MARIDFYILRQSGEQARQTFACRLAEKAYRLDNTVNIHTDSKARAERLDPPHPQAVVDLGGDHVLGDGRGERGPAAV